MLYGAGLIHNATMCSIASDKMRILLELHGAARANLNATPVYTPDELPILTAHEVPRAEAVLRVEVNEFDQLKDRLETSQKSLDVGTLFHIQKATYPRESLPHWHLILAAIFCTFTILLILYFFSNRNFNILHRVLT